MRTMFTAEIRVLLCEHCGAPLEAPLGGGQFACTYCRAQNIVATRDERPTLGMPAMPTPVDESERIRRLRTQDHRPMVPPQSIMYLLSGSSFDPSKVQEAFLIYQATRKEVKATNSPEAAERLYFLALIASNYLMETKDDARRRAILETTLDTLFLPRHKQVLRCQLASAAAKEGDIGAAERWIGPCDERSDDLDTDSAWRVCRAYLDTCKGDFGAVIRTLGAVDEQFPIADSRDPQAAVLRANALEKMGDIQGAVTALRSRMANESASGRSAIEQFTRLNPQLALCPQSLGMATMGHATQASKVAESGAGGGVGFLLMGIGAVLLVVAVGAVVLSIGPALWFLVQNGGAMSIGGVMGSIGTGMSIALGPGIAGLVMTPIGFALYRNAKEAAYMRMHGIPARATVRNFEATGTRINNVPMIRITVTVMRDGASPYEAAFTQLASHGLMAQLRPGTQVPVRIHPQKPQKLILELQ